MINTRGSDWWTDDIGRVMRCTVISGKNLSQDSHDGFHSHVKVSFDHVGYSTLSYLCVSQKNIPDIFSCNFRKHCQIFKIFGTHVTEKVSNQ